MAQIQGLRGQFVNDHIYSFDGTITAGGTSQLVMPKSKSRSMLVLQNRSNTEMWFEIGHARATATVSAGVVTGFTITNGGFGYVKAPGLICFGGGPPSGNADANLGGTDPTWPSPSKPATGFITISGGIVSAIAVQGGGAGYLRAPYVFIGSQEPDSIGCADPNYGSVKTGIYLKPWSDPFVLRDSCPTDPIAVFCATTGEAFTARMMY